MPDVGQASGMFWATVFGAAIGVVAGTIIQYLLTLILDRQSQSRQMSALVKELAYNKSLVDEIAEEVRKLRNAVNGGVFHKYFGYMYYSRGLFAQANASIGNGTFYRVLSTEDIRHAQRIASTLSQGNENWVYNEITRRRNSLINTPDSFDSRELVSFVDFLEKQIGETGFLINGLTRALS